MHSKRWMSVALFAGALALAANQVRAADQGSPDAWLTTKTKIAVLSAVGSAGSRVNVDTVRGHVTLHGTVTSAEESKKAEEAAHKVEGVTEVTNMLQVVAAEKRDEVTKSDSEVQDRVASALHQDKHLEGSDISVASVNAGAVLLSGQADSLADHLRAIEVAREIPGVKTVRSEIESPDAEADAGIYRHAAKKLGETGEKARSSSRTTGEKLTSTAREAGEKTKSAARGITGVASDAWITSTAKARLIGDEKTPAGDINVDTENGAVTLSGTVSSKEAKQAAERQARSVDGVKSVRNELQVVAEGEKKPVAARDDQLEEEAEEAIEDRKELRDADIDVEVNNGVARLTGTVESETERISAAEAARKVDGIRSIHNELHVRSDTSLGGEEKETD